MGAGREGSIAGPQLFAGGGARAGRGRRSGRKHRCVPLARMWLSAGKAIGGQTVALVIDIVGLDPLEWRPKAMHVVQERRAAPCTCHSACAKGCCRPTELKFMVAGAAK